MFGWRLGNTLLPVERMIARPTRSKALPYFGYYRNAPSADGRGRAVGEPRANKAALRDALRLTSQRATWSSTN